MTNEKCNYFLHQRIDDDFTWNFVDDVHKMSHICDQQYDSIGKEWLCEHYHWYKSK